MADKVTAMELKVDLQCPRCYRKIKKVLCKFPEVRDQMYDEKQNKVKINVMTCCPEIIRKRISSKGGRSIESIEIIADKKKEPEKKKEGGEKDKPKDSPAEKKKDAGAEKPKDATADKRDPPKGAVEKKESPNEKPKQAAEKKPEAQVLKDVFEPVSGFPTFYPSGPFYDNQPFYQGYGGGVPCFHGHGRLCTCYGVPAYEGYVGNSGVYNNTGRFNYFSEENPEACSIM